jgi:hypothetical protein
MTVDQIERRVRTACQAVVPHLLDTELARADDDEATLTVVSLSPAPPRRARRAVAVAVGLVLVAGAGAGWLVLERATTDREVVSGPSPSAPPVVPEPASTVTTVPCFGDVCAAVDALAVAPGAADFYVGPLSLGEPTVHIAEFGQVGLTRCVELSADGRTCLRIEGMAGVPLVSYPTELSNLSTVPGDASEQAGIEIGTTYTELAPADYAQRWGELRDPVTVRGHEGVRFSQGPHELVAWQEQPGVLVWVAVPAAKAGDLLPIAEGVRRLDGPATIPHVVVVTPLAEPWEATDNNANGVVYGRLGDRLCVGAGWIPEDCAPVTGRLHSSGTVQVTGMTPSATRVRVDIAGVDPVEVDTVAFAGAPEVRFFDTQVPGGTAGEHAVTFLAADGTELDTVRFIVTAPDVAPADTTVPPPATP